jgi:hypothetical protein
MLWKKKDFIREVRRQLVELESLRKKITAKQDVEDNLKKLEASQYSLLRKLEEQFESTTDGSVLFSANGQVPEDVEMYVKALLQHPQLLEQLGGHIGSGEFGASVVIVGLNGGLPKRCLEGLEGDFFGQPYSLN